MPEPAPTSSRPEGLSFVADLAALVQVAEEATVSRTIMTAER